MDDERATLARVRVFDEQALAEVYDLYSEGIYRYAWRLLGSQDLAEECLAETFSRFLHAVKMGGGPKQHLRAYLYRTAHNWITDQYRRQPLPSLDLDQVQLPAESESPSTLSAMEIEIQEVRAALAHLTPDQRQVIALRYLEGRSHQEIALVMEKPVGAVKSLQHRGISALRRIFGVEVEVKS